MPTGTQVYRPDAPTAGRIFRNVKRMTQVTLQSSYKQHPQRHSHPAGCERPDNTVGVFCFHKVFE